MKKFVCCGPYSGLELYCGSLLQARGAEMAQEREREMRERDVWDTDIYETAIAVNAQFYYQSINQSINQHIYLNITATVAYVN